MFKDVRKMSAMHVRLEMDQVNKSQDTWFWSELPGKSKKIASITIGNIAALSTRFPLDGVGPTPFGWCRPHSRVGGTSEYPATHALLKFTASVVLGPYSTS